MSNMEQYGRRNSLRFTNMKVKQIDFSTETEFKKHMVNFINSTVLKKEESGVSISVEDVDRCHAVGIRDSPQVLVKFRNYETKHLVYASKKNLKRNPGKVFVSESRHPVRLALMECLSTQQQNKVERRYK